MKREDMHMELVSIIVPVYNVEKYLARCVDSLIHQTYSNIEIILVDDGSTDSSGELCDKFVLSDPRITVVHKKNGGLSDARNTGIENASGEYLMFIDSDDFIMPEMIEQLYKSSSDDNDLVICDFDYVNEVGKIIDFREKNALKEGNWSKEEFWNFLFSTSHCVCVCVWNKLYKKDWFSYIRFKTGKHNEDAFIIKSIIDQVSNIKYISKKLYCYTQRSDSIMGNYSLKNLDSVEAFTLMGEEFWSEHCLIFAESAITLALEFLLDGYLKLDMGQAETKERYTKLKTDIRKIFIKMQKGRVSFHFRLNTLVFLMSEKMYLFLHEKFGKKVYERKEN